MSLIDPETPPPSTAGNTAGSRASIFHGANGLRAGWSFLLFLAIAAVLVFVAPLSVAPIAPAPAPDGVWRPLTLAFGDIMTLLISGIAIAVMARVERGTLDRYFLGLAGARGRLTRAVFGDFSPWGV